MIHSFLWFFLSGMNILGLLILIILQVLFFKNTVVIYIWIIALGIISFFGYQHAAPFWKDIQADRIKTASGEITKKHYYRGGGRNGEVYCYCTVYVNNLVFGVSPTLYSSLMDGGHYRLFYAPHSKWVLNVDTI
jgi:hypothetical protein